MISVLPPCSARQIVFGESVCTHEANTGRRVILRECASCHLIGTTTNPEVPNPQPPLAVVCAHRGNQVRQEKCVPCGGAKTTTVFFCELHVECQPSKRAAGVRSCLSCVDYSKPSRPRQPIGNP